MSLTLSRRRPISYGNQSIDLKRDYILQTFNLPCFIKLIQFSNIQPTHKTFHIKNPLNMNSKISALFSFCFWFRLYLKNLICGCGNVLKLVDLKGQHNSAGNQHFKCYGKKAHF